MASPASRNRPVFERERAAIPSGPDSPYTYLSPGRRGHELPELLEKSPTIVAGRALCSFERRIHEHQTGSHSAALPAKECRGNGS